MGTVYLTHFDEKLSHASHYLGYTDSDNPQRRLDEHAAGRGARIMQVIAEKGIKFRLVRTWKGDRKLERQLKKQKKSTKLCPICCANKKAA